MPPAAAPAARQRHVRERAPAPQRAVLRIAVTNCPERLSSPIVVLDGGRVIATGTHESLMAESGVYVALFAAGDEL